MEWLLDRWQEEYDNDVLEGEEMERYKIKEKILRRRRQILVHSCIYYRFNETLISDAKFDEWAYEMVDLQEKYPNISKETELYNDFKDFDGSTGFNLSITKSGVMSLAKRLIEMGEGSSE